MVEILGQRVEAEILGDARHAPGLGLGLEGAEHHLSGVRLVVGAFVRHAQHRQVTEALDRLGDQIEMLAGMERQRHPRPRRQLAPPHAAAIDDHIGGDVARRVPGDPVDPGHAPAVVGHGRDRRALDDPRAAHPGALRQGHRDVGRIALAVERQVDRSGHALDVQVRIHRGDLGRADLVHFDAEGARERRLPQQFLAPRVGQCDRDRADLPHAGGDAGLRLQLDVELGGILGQPRHVLAAPELSDQPGRVPGRAAGQLPPLQQDDVRPPRLREMIGDGAARDAAPDDDRTCALRRKRHARSLSLPGSQSGPSPRTVAGRRSP